MSTSGTNVSGATREATELALIYEISQILDQTLDIREVVGPVLKTMAKHRGMLRGTIALVDLETGDLLIEAAHGLSRSQRDRGRYRKGEGVVGKVVETGQPAVVPKIAEEPLFLNRTGARKTLRKKDISFICVPIVLEKTVIGTLSADRLFDEAVSFHEDVRLLSIIASMVAQAIRLRQLVRNERQKLVDENTRLQSELRERFHPSNMVGRSHAMQQVFDLLAKVASTDTTVLIRGESGTGKELVAQAVHYNSPRAAKPLIKVNCAALPESVLESELFGHEKGAFTGATQQRKGRFELADGGTIFLDEIGDLSVSTQIRFLRVLQEREFERVGGSQTLRCNVRVIAATNRNLETLIRESRFREDLYYRLNVFPIHLPPLRERKTDIVLLADHFVEKYARAAGKNVLRISTPAIDMMMSYHWPGNVRELENCIERAVIMTGDDVIHGHHLPPSLQSAEATGTVQDESLHASLDNLEREMITEALKMARGNCAKAANQLGLTERIMGLRLKKHGIDWRRFRSKY